MGLLDNEFYDGDYISYKRLRTRGDYDVDFYNLNSGCDFPSAEVLGRNIQYRMNMSLYNGSYAYNKKLIAIIDDVRTPINYNVLSLNRFELIVNKLDSLLFGNDATISTGNIERDKIVNKLVEKTGWYQSIRKGVKLCEIYGDAVLKTGINGVSPFSPLFAYKVLDIHDKNKVQGYVLHELIYDRINKGGNIVAYEPNHIRLLISCKGFEFERVYEYTGTETSGTLGNPVKYKYNGRWIPQAGKYYNTNVNDCETVQWLSVNTEKDGVYGASSFENVKDIVFAIENRISAENWVIDNHEKPILILGMSNMRTNESTGQYTASIVQGKYMISKGVDEQKPEYLSWDGKLENSKQLRDDLMESFYELTEMSKTFLTGSYTGNVSEESLNNMIKSALDRGTRDLNDMWYAIRNSLYVLCKLNSIDIEFEDININFNVGRVDDYKVISEICQSFAETGLMSKETMLTRFLGYNSDDAKVELCKIASETENINNNKGGENIETK